MKLSRLIFLTLTLIAPSCLWAQSFNSYFINKTLRLDYQFAGNDKEIFISLDNLSTLPQWAGRRVNLNNTPLEGNGQVIVRDMEGKNTIYKTAFSSLFQEWLTIEEARQTTKSFENTFLIPFPKQAIEVEVMLFNTSRDTVARLIHTISPDDILIATKGINDVTKHRYLLHSGEPSEVIDIAIIGEGYTAQEEDLFYADAEKALESIFYYEPFASMKESFNVVAIFPEAKESGVSVPRNGVWKDSPMGSHFDTFYSERYLTTSRVKAVHDIAAGIPYEHIVILANTDVYGGGGIYNAYTLTTAHHSQFKPVVAHEFGHSFGGLGDEYFYDNDSFENMYPLDIEPWEQNITTLVYPEEKWADMLPPNIPIPTPTADEAKYPVGIYEGGGYVSKGVYRPAFDCRMRTNAAEAFCPVCQRALQRVIEHHIKEKPTKEDKVK